MSQFRCFFGFHIREWNVLLQILFALLNIEPVFGFPFLDFFNQLLTVGLCLPFAGKLLADTIRLYMNAVLNIIPDRIAIVSFHHGKTLGCRQFTPGIDTRSRIQHIVHMFISGIVVFQWCWRKYMGGSRHRKRRAVFLLQLPILFHFQRGKILTIFHKPV
ncbi:Uncharacterised protein [Faecalibacterium prausnitzii]|nr:Uncharacterised protein [Faecalibacterium prausnitzii]